MHAPLHHEAATALLSQNVLNSVAQDGVDVDVHGFVFINDATAASLTDEANVIAAIGAIANDGGNEQLMFVINRTVAGQAGVYAYVDDGNADAAVVSEELTLLAIVNSTVAFADLSTF